MADDSDLEKTESASARRLEQAREEGQVPHSRELATFIALMAGVTALYVLGDWAGQRMLHLFRSGLTLERSRAFAPDAMGQIFEQLALDALLTLAPLFVVLIVAALVTPFLMGGWVFTTKVLTFDVSRLDPLQGLGRMFSTHGLAELVKASLKSVIVASVGVWVVWRERDHLFALMLQPVEESVGEFASLLLLSSLLIVVGLGIIAAMDVPYQLWEYHRKLRMTKE
ncbi:MAG TPA: EscU/YscU/HrcU family type III secretion system export apparatus switch protein, partial [Rhodocyclaceae bacterium]|nr:EscU/YscU/HrcU family type III secretion system export apparatus switch protein [Rhodocyclaceae bacterium]